MEKFSRGLTEYQRAFLRQYPHPQLFCVVSWGCAATAWLARVLNRHPDIYCVHAANLAWHVLGNADKQDGVEYLRIIGQQGHAHVAAGEVHGVSRNLVTECRHALGEKFNAVVVVRDPVSRLHSQLALYQDFEGLQAWNIDHVEAILTSVGLAVAASDYESRFFVHAANMLNAILDESGVGRIYRSEDLTSSRETLGEFVQEITRGKVSPDSDWLQSALQTKPVNVHAGRRPRRELTDWQMDVVRRVVDQRAWETYESLGYAPPDFAAASAGTKGAVSA